MLVICKAAAVCEASRSELFANGPCMVQNVFVAAGSYLTLPRIFLELREFEGPSPYRRSYPESGRSIVCLSAHPQNTLLNSRFTVVITFALCCLEHTIARLFHLLSILHSGRFSKELCLEGETTVPSSDLEDRSLDCAWCPFGTQSPSDTVQSHDSSSYA